MQLYDISLCFGLAVCLIYSIVSIVRYIQKVRRRKSVPQKKAVSKKVVALSTATGTHFRLNLMALEAARQMSATATRNGGGDSSR